MFDSVRLEELAAPVKSAMATGPFGSAVSSKNFRPYGIPMLRGSNLSEDVGKRLVESDLVYLEPELAETFARSIARPGDLIFTCWGTVGQIGLLDGTSKHDQYIVSNKQMKLTPDQTRIDSLFLYYYLSQPRMLDLVKGQAIGSTIPGFNLGQLRALRVQVPARAEQQAIAEVLGALDDKVATNLRVAEAAFDLAGTLYDRAVAAIPVRMMSQVLTPILGGTPSRANDRFWGGSHLWASAKDVTGAQSGVIIDTDEKISDVAVESTKAKPLPVGGVILTARGTVGAVARLAIPSSFNQSCYGFAPGELPAGVLYFSILRATERAKAFAHGSVFDTITMRTFDHLHLPDLDAAGVFSLEAVVTPLLDTVTSAVTQNSALVATRDALLPQLMSGKLRVKDAEKVLEGVL